jgi:hypothetical protein
MVEPEFDLDIYKIMRKTLKKTKELGLRITALPSRIATCIRLHCSPKRCLVLCPRVSTVSALLKNCDYECPFFRRSIHEPLD